MILPAGLALATQLCPVPPDPLRETPPGYVERLRPSPYPACVAGMLTVDAWTRVEVGRTVESHEVEFRLYSLPRPVQEWREGALLDPLEGDDDCGLLVYGRQGLDPGGQVTWGLAGPTTASGTWGEAALTPRNGIGVAADLAERGIPAAFGAAYSVASRGPDGVDLPELVSLPERLDLTWPWPVAPGSPLTRADLELRWTGSGAGTVEVFLHATGPEPPSYELVCAAVDDGQFVVPGRLLAQIPPGRAAALVLRRTSSRLVQAPDGRWFSGLGTAGWQVSGLRLE